MAKIFLKKWCSDNGVAYINMWRYFVKIKDSGKKAPVGVEFIGRNVVISDSEKTNAALLKIASGFETYKKGTRNELSN